MEPCLYRLVILILDIAGTHHAFLPAIRKQSIIVPVPVALLRDRNLQEEKRCIKDVPMGSKPIGYSASRCAAIIGLNEWQSQFEIWQILMEELQPGFNASRGFILPPPPGNAAIRWGHAFENAAIWHAEESEKSEITDREKLYQSGKLTCHIDGMYNNGKLHEGKTTSIMAYRTKWGEPGTDHVPQSYQVQVQQQLICTKAPEAILSVFVFPRTPDEFEKDGWEVCEDAIEIWKLYRESDDISTTPHEWAEVLNQMGFFHQYPIESKADTQKLIIEAVEDFHHNHILTATPPEIEKYEDVRRAFPSPVGTIVCDDTLSAWIHEYRSIRDEIGTSGPLKKRQDQLKVFILDKARSLDPPIDDDSMDKTIFMSRDGKKLASYNGKTFR